MGTRVYLGRLPYNVRERDVERFFKGYGRLRDVMLKNGYGFVEFEDYRDAEDAVYELNGKDLCGERISVEHARGTPRGSDRYNDINFDRYPPRRGGGGGYRGSRQSSARDKYGPPTRTGNRVIVENLSSRVSWQDLKDYMRQAGEVTYADAHRENKNEGHVTHEKNLSAELVKRGKPQFAHILKDAYFSSTDGNRRVSSYSEMKRAIEKLDGTEINGRKIKLIEDKTGKRRSTRSRSDSRRLSRSRSRRSESNKSRSGSRKSASKSRSRSPSNGHSKSRSRSPSKSPAKSPEKIDAKSQSRSRSKSVGEEEKMMNECMVF